MIDGALASTFDSPQSICAWQSTASTPLEGRQMLPAACADHTNVRRDEDHLIVSVIDRGESYRLAPITALVWELSDGHTTVQEIMQQASQALGITLDIDTIWAALDCLADAGLLSTRLAPPAAHRSDMMQRMSIDAGLTSTSFPSLPVDSGTDPSAANGEQQTKEQHGKHEEEGRKQEEGAKEHNNKFMERQAKQQEQYQKQVEQNQKQEQANKEQMNK